jgi:hypothetical protein
MREPDMTRKPSRVRRWLKWVGLVASTAVFVVWVVGYWYDVTYTGATWRVAFGRGCTGVAWGSIVVSQGWNVEEAGEFYVWPPLLWLQEALIFPVWIPLALVAVSTAFFWYRDGRPPPGRCQGCGYYLTGNVTGRCPECGESCAGMLQ